MPASHEDIRGWALLYRNRGYGHPNRETLHLEDRYVKHTTQLLAEVERLRNENEHLRVKAQRQANRAWKLQRGIRS